MGCPYQFRSEGELEEYRSQFGAFLYDAASGDATVSDYREALPDRRFVAGVLPDEFLQEMALQDELDRELEEQFYDADGLDDVHDYGADIVAELESREYRTDVLLDRLQNEEETLNLHGTELMGEYVHLERHMEDSSVIGKLLGAFPKTLTRAGYARASPDGDTVDELEEEQDNSGIVGRLTPSLGKTWAVLGGGIGMTATGAVIGEPALMDAGTVTAYSTLPMVGSNLYHTGRDEQYEDAIAERTADQIEAEIGDYTVDVIESAPFRLAVEK